MASIAQEPAAHEPAPRIRLAPLARRFVLALVAPVLLALLADRLLGTGPWLTLAAIALCIPLASVLVSSAALRDLDRVIAQVAPQETEAPTAEDAGSAGETVPGAGEPPAEP